MSEIVSSWLLFTHTPAHQFGELIRRLQDGGWVVFKKGGEYRCLVDDDLKYIKSFDEVIERLNSAVTGSIKIKLKQTEIRVRKNADDDYAPPELTNIHLRAWDTEFRPSRHDRKEWNKEVPTRAYIKTMRRIVEELDPEYGYAKYPEYVNLAAMPTYDDVLDARLRGAFWLNVFGPEYVKRLGRDQIESAPAWKIEELDTGHYLVVANDNPVRPSEQWEGALDELADHFNVERG